MGLPLTPEGRVHSDEITNLERRIIGELVVANYGNIKLPSGDKSFVRVGRPFTEGRLFLLDPKHLWDEKKIATIGNLEDNNTPAFNLPNIGDLYRDINNEKLVQVYAGLARLLLGEADKIASYWIICRAALPDENESPKKVNNGKVIYGVEVSDFLNPENFDPIYNQNV